MAATCEFIKIVNCVIRINLHIFFLSQKNFFLQCGNIESEFIARLSSLNSPGYSPSTNEQHKTKRNTLINQKFILIAIPYGAKHNFHELFFLLLTVEKSILSIKSIFKLELSGRASGTNERSFFICTTLFDMLQVSNYKMPVFFHLNSRHIWKSFVFYFFLHFSLSKKLSQWFFFHPILLGVKFEGEKSFFVNESLPFYESKSDSCQTCAALSMWTRKATRHLVEK